ILTQHFESNKRIFLFQENGYYEYNNLLFAYTHLYSEETVKFDFPTDKIKISLYHGILNDLFKFGLKKEELKGKFNTTDFRNTDYLLLGDVHRLLIKDN